jgi:hypothetical protein
MISTIICANNFGKGLKEIFEKQNLTKETGNNILAAELV